MARRLKPRFVQMRVKLWSYGRAELNWDAAETQRKIRSYETAVRMKFCGPEDLR
jgi:hypothetical protein